MQIKWLKWLVHKQHDASFSHEVAQRVRLSNENTLSALLLYVYSLELHLPLSSAALQSTGGSDKHIYCTTPQKCLPQIVQLDNMLMLTKTTFHMLSKLEFSI